MLLFGGGGGGLCSLLLPLLLSLPFSPTSVSRSTIAISRPFATTATIGEGFLWGFRVGASGLLGLQGFRVLGTYPPPELRQLSARPTS